MTSQNIEAVVKTTDRTVFSISPRPAGEFTRENGQVVKFNDAHTLRVVSISGAGASKITVRSIDDLKIIRDLIEQYIDQI